MVSPQDGLDTEGAAGFPAVPFFRDVGPARERQASLSG